MVPKVRASAGSAPPGTLPSVTPTTAVGAADYSMQILQSTIEMQRSVGELTAKVDRLVTDV